jgi:pimeloyl-ACP methyl ester carboxylesterase
MSRFLLVHGAWHGAWCWDKVVPLLEAKGHSVDVIDLPGHGRDLTPTAEVTLELHVERVCQALLTEPEPTVLVGHSMAGMVITQAAERCPAQLQALIYLAAYLPHDGQKLLDLADMAEGASTHIRPNLVFSDDHRSATLKPAAIRGAFYNDCLAVEIERATRLLVPQATQPFAAVVHTTEEHFGRVPKAYIVCLEDHAVPTALQRRMLAELPCDKVVTLPTSHSPFISAPELLAAELDKVANDANLWQRSVVLTE